MASLFSGSVLNGATKYVQLPIRDGKIGAMVGWRDATSSATITVELSSSSAALLETAGSADTWKDSGLTITGPTAAAAGSTLVNIENVRQKLARLKIVAAANCLFDIWDGMGN